MLAGLPESYLHPLKRVQHAAARLVFELAPRDHVSSALIQLHWLPIRWRIQFKLCSVMHDIHNGRCPDYLVSIVETVSYCSHRRPGLRSAETTNYMTPRLRTKFGERAFSYAGPSAWNSLPEHLRAVKDRAKFKKLLKTHLFAIAFDVV